MKEIELPSLLQSVYLLHAGWAKADKEWNYGPICSIFMRIYWVTYGSAVVIMNGVKHELTEGHFYLIPPCTTHFDQSDGPFEHYYLHVLIEPDSWSLIADQYTMPFEIKADKLLCRSMAQTIQEHLEMQLSHTDPVNYESSSDLFAATRQFSRLELGVQCSMVSLILLFLSHFLQEARRRPSITDKRIVNVICEIDKSLSQPLSIEKMAAQTALSTERFIRLFRKQTGMTPKRYVIMRKIWQAQHLLSSNKMSIKEVARQVGYGSISYFCQLFHQQVGMTPKEFQRQNT